MKHYLKNGWLLILPTISVLIDSIAFLNISHQGLVMGVSGYVLFLTRMALYIVGILFILFSERKQSKHEYHVGLALLTIWLVWNVVQNSIYYPHYIEMVRHITQHDLPLIIRFAAHLSLLVFILTQFIKPKQKVENKACSASVERNRIVAGILAFLFGAFGAHRYYLGYKKKGMIQTAGSLCIIIGYIIYDNMTRMISRIDLEDAIPCVILSVLGCATSIWALVDFIRILTGGLKPADGSEYAKNATTVQVVQSAPSLSDNIEALEKLAKLHEQGIITDDEFNAKKADILAKM